MNAQPMTDAQRWELATVPNETETMLQLMNRAQLIRLCAWNDRNGVWTDAQCRAEQYQPHTHETLRLHVRNWLNDIAPATDPTVELCEWLHRAGIVVLP